MEDRELKEHHVWVASFYAHHCLVCPAGDGVYIKEFNLRHDHCRVVKAYNTEELTFILKFCICDDKILFRHDIDYINQQGKTFLNEKRMDK